MVMPTSEPQAFSLFLGFAMAWWWPPKLYPADDDLELLILRPLFPKSWDSSLTPLCFALCTTFSIVEVLNLPNAIHDPLIQFLMVR